MSPALTVLALFLIGALITWPLLRWTYLTDWIDALLGWEDDR